MFLRKSWMLVRNAVNSSHLAHINRDCTPIVKHGRVLQALKRHLTIAAARESLKDLVGGTQKLIGASHGAAGIEMSPVAESQGELPVRSMSDSYSELIIPLSDVGSRQKYLNPSMKGIRFGRILEDLDTFSVYASYKHTFVDRSKKAAISIVTALVDRIEKQDEIAIDVDIIMSGNVTWAGRSSMEVTTKLQQKLDSGTKTILVARFLMVARNPQTKKAAVVCALKPQNPEEEQIFQMGEESKLRRQEETKRDLLKTHPSEAERELIHEKFLQTLDPNFHTFRQQVKPDNTVWMEDTTLKNLHICFPESRNLYNKIFGGYLMRKAYELAWANTAMYCSSRNVSLLIVDDIAFLKSVEIRSLLLMSSQVVYTQDKDIQIHVHAEVIDPDMGSQSTSNNFHFTFRCHEPKIPEIMPRSYAEYMLYLDGKRHFES
ncbi:acyl-coenzyme A thioesterase 9, mitochondrial-like isoform X2 [Crassostrea virginica]|uniref:Acyl-coenzyme A thioesterase 9, mitochondrial-like isoform X2 n=1 Tax=Crassostrea virginica TaxID=6565 RepID=A0A8B8EM35_CRAVI|nr:acyl-coenzyme A thioesterase 9, mitochondrial-like isoform X2 [Crassostrea virginica]